MFGDGLEDGFDDGLENGLDDRREDWPSWGLTKTRSAQSRGVFPYLRLFATFAHQ
jgi:hypothetical protein